MKRIPILCLLSLLLSHVQAQQVEADLFVSYKYHHQFDLTTDAKTDSVVLFADIDHQLAWYQNVSYDHKKATKAEVKDGDNGFVIHNKVKLSDETGTPLFTDLQNNRIQERKITMVDGKKQAFIVSDKARNIRWSLKEEFKEIGGRFYCQKAVGVLRGRTYTAWFDRSIPVSIGPWKLHGLPGLLVEAVDEKGQVAFTLSSVSYPCTIQKTISPPLNGASVSLEEFVDIEKNVAEGYIKYLKSKMPRGAVTRITSVSKTPGLEVDYSFDEK